MGVNKTSNQQLLTSLVDLLGNNLNILSKMDEQGIANTIHSYVYHTYTAYLKLYYFYNLTSSICSIHILHI